MLTGHAGPVPSLSSSSLPAPTVLPAPCLLLCCSSSLSHWAERACGRSGWHGGGEGTASSPCSGSSLSPGCSRAVFRSYDHLEYAAKGFPREAPPKLALQLQEPPLKVLTRLRHRVGPPGTAGEGHHPLAASSSPPREPGSETHDVHLLDASGRGRDRATQTAWAAPEDSLQGERWPLGGAAVKSLPNGSSQN